MNIAKHTCGCSSISVTAGFRGIFAVVPVICLLGANFAGSVVAVIIDCCLQSLGPDNVAGSVLTANFVPNTNFLSPSLPP